MTGPHCRVTTVMGWSQCHETLMLWVLVAGQWPTHASLVLMLVLRARHRGRWVGCSYHDRSVSRHCLMSLSGAQQLHWSQCHEALMLWVLVAGQWPKHASLVLMLVLRARHRGRWVGCSYHHRSVSRHCLMSLSGAQRLHWSQCHETLMLWVLVAGQWPKHASLVLMLVLRARHRGRWVGCSYHDRSVSRRCLMSLSGAQQLHWSQCQHGGDGRCLGSLSGWQQPRWGHRGMSA